MDTLTGSVSRRRPPGRTEAVRVAGGLLAFCAVLLVASAGSPGKAISSGGPQSVVRMEAIGQLGGAVRAVSLAGTRAYVGLGPRLAVLELANPGAPRLLSRSGVLGDVVQDVLVDSADARVYVAAGSDGVHVFEIEGDGTLRPVSAVALGARAVSLAQRDTYVLVGTEGGGVRIVDVSQPASPEVVGEYGEAGGLTVWAIDLIGEGVVLAADAAGVLVVEFAAPGALTFVESYESEGYARDVQVSSDVFYIAAEPRWHAGVGGFVGGGLRVVARGVDGRLVEVGFLGEVPGLPQALAATGQHVYLACGEGGLLAIDVERAAEPRLLGSVATVRSAEAVALEGTMLVVAESGGGLRTFGIENPEVPRSLGLFSELHDVQDVAVVGTLAYAADGLNGLKVVDLAWPGEPRLASSLRLVGYASGVATLGDVAFVTTQDLAMDQDGGLYRVNVTAPSGPREEGRYRQPVYAMDVELLGEVGLVAAGSEGAYMLDVGAAEDPALLGILETPGSARGSRANGEVAYVADGGAGLQVVDVKVPSNPTIVGRCPTVRDGWAVVVSGTLCYVADGRHGIAVVDVSRPEVPVEVGRVNVDGSARGLTLESTFLFVAEMQGVSAHYLGIPRRPSLGGFLDLPGQVMRVEAVSDLLLVAAGEAGLFVVRVTKLEPTPTPSPTATLTRTPRATRTQTATATSAPRLVKAFLPVALRGAGGSR